MGVDRSLNVVALQALLMSGVRNHGGDPAVAVQTHRLLATAASLDYVLMLATGSAGTRIPLDDAQRAIHDGLARAVDDALVLLRVLAAVDPAFARDGVRTVRGVVDAESLANDRRMFELIALTSDLAAS